MTTPSAMIEADLHGLVDGQIDATRRVGVLRLLAASPADRAQVEAWQTQGDVLRSAFAGVDREPIPVTLQLKTRPPLHCVPANDAPLVAPIVQPRPPHNRIASLVTAVIIAAGLFGSWTVLNQAAPDDGMETATTPHGAIDAMLANRTAAALDTATPADTPAVLDLPTAKIPDLHAAGFGLVGATTVGAQPQAIVFRYQNKKDDRIVLSVARAAEPSTTQPAPIGTALTWTRGDTLYAMAGTMDRSRLRAIAATLQAER